MTTDNQTPLELGDFVCPRYYTEVFAATATEQADVYQVIEVRDNEIVAQRVSDPAKQIVASEDFFISLE